MEKLTSPNMTFPFDCNLLFLLVADEFMVCLTTFIVRILKSGEPLLTDLDHKGAHSNKSSSQI